MGFGHLALTVVLLQCAMLAAASPLTPTSRAHSLFEPRKSLSSNRGPLKPASYLANGPSPIHVTKIPPPPSTISIPPSNPTVPNNSTINGTSTGNSSLKIELCLDCIDFMNANLDTLIAIVTRIGVTDTCDKICGMLNSSVDVDACNVMCDAIGGETFWHMFVSAGINPIYACEIVNACSVGPSPAVSFSSSSTITPPLGPPGTIFDLKIPFTVVNETGVGEYAFVIYYPTATDHELGFISQSVFADYIPGDYVATLSFPTNSSFLAGKYLVLFDLCSGACGQEPDPYPFAYEEVTFNITTIGN